MSLYMRTKIWRIIPPLRFLFMSLYIRIQTKNLMLHKGYIYIYIAFLVLKNLFYIPFVYHLFFILKVLEKLRICLHLNDTRRKQHKRMVRRFWEFYTYNVLWLHENPPLGLCFELHRGRKETNLFDGNGNFEQSCWGRKTSNHNINLLEVQFEKGILSCV